LQVHVELGGFGFRDAFLGPTPDLSRQRAGDIVRQAERLADLAHGAARAVADDGGAQRGAVAAIGVVDPLDDFLATLVLEVDVDVGRFAPLGTDKALEQQTRPSRIDRRDPKHVAHR